VDGLILSPEKRAKAGAIAPNIVDQGGPFVRNVRRVQKSLSQRKTRCNRSDRLSFSKQPLDQ
jgi:hypothetical protein